MTLHIQMKLSQQNTRDVVTSPLNIQKSVQVPPQLNLLSCLKVGLKKIAVKLNY